jgi:Carboxypeptidase regulatory-like domain/TonB dependent receptor-like, beta-barrel
MDSFRIRSAALLSSLLLTAASAWAQQGTAEIRGRVTDQQTASLPGVTVVVTNQATGNFREATSTGDGSWFMAALPPGQYQVAAQLQGFKRFMRRDIVLAVGNQMTVDIQLELGTLEETVTVAGESPMIDVTSKEIGGNISTKELSDIPSIARNFTYFAGLLPGIVPTANLASWGSDTLTANGVDSRNNSYLVDGAWDNDDYLGQNNGAQARVPLDAAQEFQVLTGQFDAEFGRTSGAIVNAVIKSGTNMLHGSAFEFFYNKDLRALDFFQAQNNLAKADTQKHEFGGSIGGPIKKDKIHFFVDLERVRLNEGRTIQIPARPDLNYTTITETRVIDSVYRVDHQISANHSWGARWITEFSPQKNQTNNAAVTLTAAQQEWDRDDTGSVHLNSVFGTSKVNTMRLSLTREDDRFAPNNFPGCKQNVAIGLVWSANFGDCVAINENAMRTQGPNLTYLTFQDGVRNAGTHWITDSPEFSDTFSWYVPGKKGGAHDVKFGFQMYYVRWHFQNNAQLNGTFTIPSNNSFNAADPRTYPERLTIQVPTDQYITMTQRAYTGFVQDKWHVSSRATFNLGLRYDVDFTPLDETGNKAFSDPNDYPVDKNNISPRVGFTYTMDEGRSLIRTGWGLFYDKTNFGQLNSYVTSGVNVASVTAQFPVDNFDPGPRAGRLPTDPMLVNGPTVNFALLNKLYPPGSLVRNTGEVFLDAPDRVQPHTQQTSVGYQRQLGAHLSASADYVHTIASDLWELINLNQGLRINTTAAGRIDRPDPTFLTNVWTRANVGSYTYDALNLVLEKRDSRNWSGRVSYTLAYSRGNTTGSLAATDQFQTVSGLNLDLNQGPTDFDRRHNLVFSGRGELPHTRGMTLSATLRLLSGLPFTLNDTSSDPDRNGQLFDPLPAGSYSGTGPNAITVDNDGGRNGAYGPGFLQLDTRVGWRLRPSKGRTIDLTADILNVTNRSNFVSPTGDKRSTNFLLLTTLYGGGQPRQAQLGVRFGF